MKKVWKKLARHGDRLNVPSGSDHGTGASQTASPSSHHSEGQSANDGGTTSRIPSTENMSGATSPVPQSETSVSAQVPPNGSLSSAGSVSGDFDTDRSKERYRKACDDLEEMLETYRQHWDTSELPNLDNLPENEDISMLQKEIANYFAARERSQQNKSAWSTIKGIIEKGYTALSPFAKTFLSVAGQADAVRVPCIYQLTQRCLF